MEQFSWLMQEARRQARERERVQATFRSQAREQREQKEHREDRSCRMATLRPTSRTKNESEREREREDQFDL